MKAAPKCSSRRGFFITFEGTEGCGKSTQAGMLYAYLRKKGRKTVFVREPGSTAIGEKIRRVLLDRKNGNMSRECELLLYMAARAQIVQEKIRPKLEEGYIVICDRYLDSTRAYQGYGLGMDQRIIEEIGRFVTPGATPDLTILLDIPAGRGLRHRELKKDRIESRDLVYHRRVRRGYLRIAAAEPGRVKVVKVSQDKAVTQRNVRLAAAGLPGIRAV
ncbi:MAG: dTMP kinase [Candidatus Omnitrophota bacterium]|jgi:dTMP kinase|nr:dTMP kinase [Candidatus Omnitrophota bacterium]MDD3982648.1 dTMP kinase [Candidatus Omnitrophota bacterium]MDD5526294.1 dTMP kinase [Candidatus Omnitrophota bacterium]